MLVELLSALVPKRCMQMTDTKRETAWYFLKPHIKSCRRYNSRYLSSCISMGNLCVEILPGLYLCDLYAATNENLLRKVDTLVSVCKSDLSKYDVFMRNVQQDLRVVRSFTSEFADHVKLIEKDLRALKSVAVFCETGCQRSASLIAAYLMVFGDMSYDTAVTCIRSKSYDSLPTHSVYKSLLLTLEN